jgi:hypothetical protein
MFILIITNPKVLKNLWCKRHDLINVYTEIKAGLSQAQQGKLLRILKILILTVLVWLLSVK